VEAQRRAERLSNVAMGDADALCEQVVRDFLSKHGYIEALRAMDDDDMTNGLAEKELDEMDVVETMNGTAASASIHGKRGSNIANGGEDRNLKKNGNHHHNDNDSNGTYTKKDQKVQETDKNQKKRHQLASSMSAEDVGMQVESESGDDDDELRMAQERRKIRRLITEGRVLDASKTIEAKWPAIMESSIGLSVHVHSLAELIMAKNHEEGIAFARSKMWRYLAPTADEAGNVEMEPADAEKRREQARAFKDVATRAMGLFALADPKAAVETVPKLAALLSADRRRELADLVNRAILSYPEPPQAPALDRILARMMECAFVLRERAGGYGEPLELLGKN